VHRFFTPRGLFRHSLHGADSEEGGIEKIYEIPFPAIARYFHTHFDSGVRSMQLVVERVQGDRPMPGNCHALEIPKASFVYWYDGGAHVSFYRQS
jgi:hypothetical protein